MLKTVRLQTPSEDFLQLNEEPDEYYFRRFGEISLRYRTYNTVNEVTDFFTVYDGDMPVAIACFKPFDGDSAELKRVYVREPFRRRGISRSLAAREKGFRCMVLETGVQNTEAVALYENIGYEKIQNFGQFATDSFCLCMKKEL